MVFIEKNPLYSAAQFPARTCYKYTPGDKKKKCSSGPEKSAEAFLLASETGRSVARVRDVKISKKKGARGWREEMTVVRRDHLSRRAGGAQTNDAAADRSIRVIEGAMMERCNAPGLPVVIATFICETFRARAIFYYIPQQCNSSSGHSPLNAVIGCVSR